ncbi:MAG: NADH-quinone oxidoreductase subunit NuoG [Pseudomonadota bacterium]
MSKVTLHVDGRTIEVPAATNLLQALLEKGIDLPYFCWHPALGSVGACRQCAVQQLKDENDKNGRVVMACMTPCADNLHLSLDHPEAAEMRKAVVEFLMTNHPHDCPVCEEGGHCHLQDMTVMTGHNYRRYNFAKRTHRNQDLGPFIGHEMNRCISCYRCVRYYRDYAGGKDLDAFGSASNVYFGRASDGALESEFSGNLVEVCPTGVFTDKPYGESYTRKWDLQQSPSICGSCSIGCNLTVGERYGSVKRIENRYHGEINGYFICDRGRYGYQFTNDAARPRRARAKNGEVLTADAAVARAAALFKSGRVLGIGSPRASLEANHALRELVGAGNFFRGESKSCGELNTLGVEILSKGPARIASIHDAETADAVLVLGEDVLNTGARLALALRQSVRQEAFKMAAHANIPLWQDSSIRILAQDAKSPLYIATPAATGLDEIATRTFRDTPARIAALAQQIVHMLDSTAAPAAGLGEADTGLAREIAEALKQAERPLIVSGTGCGSAAVMQAAANVCTALAKAGKTPQISLVFPDSNSVGTTLMGGGTLDDLVHTVQSSKLEAVIVLENDLLRHMTRQAADNLLALVPHLTVIDCVATSATEQANLLLPAGSFAESDGTLVNNEGRAQRYFQTLVPKDCDIQESWRWIQQIARACGRDFGDDLDALTAACAAAHPKLAGIVNAAPNAKFRISGLKIPRQSHRYSGRTAMDAKADVHEPRPPQDRDTPLAFSMEGARNNLPAAEIPIFWAPRWNSPQSVTRFQQEINGPLKGGDPGVRLLAPDANARPAYHAAAMTENPGLCVTPLHHLFGSEALSARGAALQTKIPAAYVGLSPATAQKLKLSEGIKAEFEAAGVSMILPVRLKPELADSLVGLPVGLKGVPAIAPGTALKFIGIVA